MRKNSEKGRVKEAVPKDNDEAARELLELENGLREAAQRGVMELFNAVRAARSEGVVGIKKTNDRDYDVEERRFRTMEAATTKRQREAKGYLDALRGAI